MGAGTMSDRVAPRFSLASVTRGGWLTIANGAAWVVFFTFRGRGPEWLWVAVLGVMAIPLVLPLILLEYFWLHHDALPPVVTIILIGLNSIVWGYGASWIWTRVIDRPRRRRRGDAGLCPACGYDLRGNASGVCPECGLARA